MKRKLFLGLAALAALTITSCQKDLVINQIPEEQPIEFGTYVGRDAQTKAVSVNNANTLQDKSTTKGFGVFAFYYDGSASGSSEFTPNFMNNQNVYYSGSAWTYSPVKYWPNEDQDKLSFIAYYPYMENITLTENKISYTVPSTVKDQQDLMWNTTVLNNLTKQNLSNKVTFNFAHALSRIGFNIAAAVDGVTVSNPIADKTTITVNSVTVKAKFDKTGSLDITKTAISDENLWTVTDNTAEEVSYVLNTTNGNWKESNNVLSGDQSLIQLNNDESYVMIIPQTIAITFDINYTVFTADNSLSGNPKGTSVENNISKTINEITFEAGKAYTFNLTLGMNSVDFDATVSEWKDAGSTTVNLPINVN